MTAATRASNTGWAPAQHDGECHGSPFEKATGWCNHSAHWRVMTTREKWRANYVPAPHYYNLNQACELLNRAFGGFGCYLVGSSLERCDYRDVDVRFILADEEYDKLFRVQPKDAESGTSGWLNPRWSLLCTTISLWLSQQSGLPIDFQFQRQTQANATHKGTRSALGILIDYPGERPSDVVKAEGAG